VYKMLLYPLLLLAVSSTGTYAQSVVGFDYFDFDEPRVERPLSTPQRGLPPSSSRGRTEVNSEGSNRVQPTTHVPILQQINEHNEDGSYSYGYEAADGSFKLETRYPDGRVKGKYGYVDIHSGELKVIEYGADDLGFQPTGDLPLGIVVPVVPGGNDTGSSGGDYDQESNFDYVQEVLDIPTPLPQFNEQGSRLAVKNRARGSVPNSPSSGRFQQQNIPKEPTQNRGQDLRQPVTPRPLPRTAVPSRPANIPSGLQSIPRRPDGLPTAAVPSREPQLAPFSFFQSLGDPRRPANISPVPRRPTSPPTRLPPPVPRRPISPQSSLPPVPRRPATPQSSLSPVPRRPVGVPKAATPSNEPKMDLFSAFQTPFDFPREHIEEIERRRPGSDSAQRRPSNIPPPAPRKPTLPPTPLTTTTEAPLATTLPPFRFRPQDAIRKTVPSIRVPQIPKQQDFDPFNPIADPPIPRGSIPQRPSKRLQSLIPRQQSVNEPESSVGKPIRIRNNEQSNFIPRQQQILRQRGQQETVTEPSDQPSTAQNDIATRKPTRPRNFDPRRQRVSGNLGASVPNPVTPTIPSNTENIINKKPQRVTVRQRGRARRPPQSTRTKITEEKIPESKFPSFSAALEPTPTPIQTVATQPERSRGFFTEVEPKPIQQRRQPPRPLILAKESQAVKQPKTLSQRVEKKKSKFSAFPARDLSQQQQRTVEDLPEKDSKSEPIRLLEPVLPTVRQPERSFAPTPLPQPPKSTRRGTSTSGTNSRFSSFPIQNDTPSRPSTGSENKTPFPSRPIGSASRTLPPPVPSRQSIPQQISSQINQGVSRRLKSQRAPLLPIPEPVNPSLVNFDALIQEFTGGRAAPNGKLEPSFFNAIPVDSQEPRTGRRFRPQPAVPGASFELL